MTNKFIKLTRSEGHSKIILDTDRIIFCGSVDGKSLVKYQSGATIDGFGQENGFGNIYVEESIDTIFDMITGAGVVTVKGEDIAAMWRTSKRINR